MSEPGVVAELGERVHALLEQGDMDQVVLLLESVHPADAADFLESFPDDVSARIIDKWPPEKAAAVLAEMQESKGRDLAIRIPSERFADILDVMPPDEAAGFLENLPPDLRASLVGRMQRDEASDVAELLDFPENTAGRRMSQDFVAVGQDATADQVIEQLRSVPDDIELIYYVYVLGGSEQLRGVVSLRKLIMASGDMKVSELMLTDFVTVSPKDDIEVVADLVRRYNLIAIPVADEFGRMLGIVTVDDLIDTIHDEAEEDILRFAGSFEDADADSVRTWPVVRRRLPWLAAAAFIELILAYFLLRPLPDELLVVTISYVPLLVFVGGNTAVQAAAPVLARLAGGRAEAWSPWRQARRELQAGLVLAGLAAVATVPLVLLLGRGLSFAAVVAPAVALTVVAGAGIGASLPIILQGLKLDPAIASGPLLGSAMDIVSLLIYTSLAVNFSRLIP